MRLASSLLAASALSAAVSIAPAFANTNAGKKLYISTTPQNAPLNQAAYEALVWVEITGVGSHGETGTTTNILTYDTWDTDVVQKGKGTSNAGDPDIELARNATDPGQIALRAAANTRHNYAFKIEGNDAPDDDGTPTIRYNRGLVTGPREPHGRNEDFELEIFTLALNQKQIVVEAAAGVPDGG